jgi:acetylornithine deacetylase/succinyl-diaminopimelate desuccinylase-like protein
MTQDNFFALHRLLFPYVKYRSLRTSGRDHRVRQRKGAANGIVPSSTRLAVAIRYSAGGSPYDLGGLFAISIKEVYRSGVGIIVDIINNCHELSIQFPMDHASQKKVALGFKAKSVAGFDCCIGAIDGILIWMECPSADDCIRSKNGPLKYI